jgi:hypothetical protein
MDVGVSSPARLVHRGPASTGGRSGLEPSSPGNAVLLEQGLLLGPGGLQTRRVPSEAAPVYCGMAHWQGPIPDLGLPVPGASRAPAWDRRPGRPSQGAVTAMGPSVRRSGTPSRARPSAPRGGPGGGAAALWHARTPRLGRIRPMPQAGYCPHLLIRRKLPRPLECASRLRPTVAEATSACS